MESFDNVLAQEHGFRLFLEASHAATHPEQQALLEALSEDRPSAIRQVMEGELDHADLLCDAFFAPMMGYALLEASEECLQTLREWGYDGASRASDRILDGKPFTVGQAIAPWLPADRAHLLSLMGLLEPWQANQESQSLSPGLIALTTQSGIHREAWLSFLLGQVDGSQQTRAPAKRKVLPEQALLLIARSDQQHAQLCTAWGIAPLSQDAQQTWAQHACQAWLERVAPQATSDTQRWAHAWTLPHPGRPASRERDNAWLFLNRHGLPTLSPVARWQDLPWQDAVNQLSDNRLAAALDGGLGAEAPDQATLGSALLRKGHIISWALWAGEATQQHPQALAEHWHASGVAQSAMNIAKQNINFARTLLEWGYPLMRPDANAPDFGAVILLRNSLAEADVLWQHYTQAAQAQPCPYPADWLAQPARALHAQYGTTALQQAIDLHVALPQTPAAGPRARF